MVKRDIADFFASVNHHLLVSLLASLIEPSDYLCRLLLERVRFVYMEEGRLQTASKSIPFGTATACLLANIHLTELDRQVGASIEVLRFFPSHDVDHSLSEFPDFHGGSSVASAKTQPHHCAGRPSRRKHFAVTRPHTEFG